TASAIVNYFAKKGHVPTIEQLIPAKEEIKSEVQARAPALKPITIALDTPTAKNNDEIKDLNAKTGFNTIPLS
ncbi:hypothetical protein A2U01_0070153, partial [Trifolium medium]|nr:hypothetical protein [Trifolium medium]